MKAKKVVSLCMAALMAASLGAGTEVKASDASDVKLSFMTNVVGERAAALEKVVKDFAEKSGYEIEFSAPGENYEELMKTKMASNELPDLFTTHGWSVMRYSEYLEPVNDLDFAKDIKEQMKSVITDKEGTMYVLPMDADVAGIVYNAEVLETAGVNVDDIKTWSDFSEACQKILDSGVTPLHMGGKDNWTIGQFGDWVAPSVFVTDEENNQKDQLKSGEFDAASWEKVAGLMDEWVKAGYFNKDASTADYNSDVQSLAEGKAAFVFYGNSSIVDAHKVNPDAKLGMMPIPAYYEGDTQSLIAGEDIAVGVWKDSPNKEAAIELLNYLATPEVIAEVATAAGAPTGLNGTESDIGDIQTYYDKYKDIPTFPYFDREYLPSGMWDVMCATGADILAQKDNCVENAGKVMQENFNDKL